MLRSGVIGRSRKNPARAVFSPLARMVRPASSGPVRYWQDRARLAVKGAIAAVMAWVLARYAVGQPDPYFAPLAALLGVYPTVTRSLREGIQYISGFLIGAALAIPVGMLLGPGIPGIAVVVLIGMLLSSWRRLGDQSAQVTFTALFGLLLGGHQPLSYITHRMVDVGIGVVTGLAVNVLVFPPLQLRPAEHAVRQWGEDIARALQDLAAAAAEPDTGSQLWPPHDRQLTVAAEQARAAVRNARESLRWNPRALRRTRTRSKSVQGVPRPNGEVLDSLEELTARTRAIARSLAGTTAGRYSQPIPASFGEDYARFLQSLARAVRELADLRSAQPHGDTMTALAACQHHLEREAAQLPGHSDVRSAAQHLTRLSSEMIREVAGHSGHTAPRPRAQ
jgi:uncharacterized membrane protein YgaE (UPF0421/DUF939 family)